MSTLTYYPSSHPSTPVSQSSDHPDIQQQLAHLGVAFERWPVKAVAAANAADPQHILQAYQAEIDRLKASHGYTTVDVARITPDHPDRAAMRLKFIEEHTHDDDEVRYFTEGSGAFYLHLGDGVYQVVCEAGDLISVPAHTKHWFDMGPVPHFTAIRLFKSPEGWVGKFTGDPIASQVPRLDGVAA